MKSYAIIINDNMITVIIYDNKNQREKPTLEEQRVIRNGEIRPSQCEFKGYQNTLLNRLLDRIWEKKPQEK